MLDVPNPVPQGSVAGCSPEFSRICQDCRCGQARTTASADEAKPSRDRAPITRPLVTIRSRAVMPNRQRTPARTRACPMSRPKISPRGRVGSQRSKACFPPRNASVSTCRAAQTPRLAMLSLRALTSTGSQNALISRSVCPWRRSQGTSGSSPA